MDKIDIGLDPTKVTEALSKMADSTKDLAHEMDKSLGRNAVDSMQSLQTAAENGSNKIKGFFEGLSKKVKDDMKSAFDATGIMQGSKFMSEMASGVKSVFDMEKAFAKLQVRLGLTASEFSNMKKEMGRAVAGTGSKLEDVLPGVETVTARGGLKDPKQLTAVAEMLGKIKATTGEETNPVAEDVVETLKNQNKEVNAANIKTLLDTIMGTRKAGAFGTAGEAAGEIMRLSAFKGTGLNTRELGGLAAQASTAGGKGTQILESLLAKTQQVGGKEQVNAMMQALGGGSIFKNGKLDLEALGKVDFKKVGGLSAEQAAGLTGVEGATGSDLVRFFDAFKKGNQEFKSVVSGQEEMTTQFGQATDNMASKFDQFKEKLKSSTREIGQGMSEFGGALIKGDISGAGHAAMGVGKSLWENKGTVAGGMAATAASAMLMGGGINKLLSKIPGGGMLGGALGAQAAEMAGAQKVYVTNYGDFKSAGSSAIDLLGVTKAPAEAGGLLTKLLGGASSALGIASKVAAPAALAYAALSASDVGEAEDTRTGPRGMSLEELGNLPDKVAAAVSKVDVKMINKGPMTNPSAKPNNR